MKTTKTYLSGCTWCNATGQVFNPKPIQYTGDPPIINCPVCDGAGIITVTEVIEYEDIP